MLPIPTSLQAYGIPDIPECHREMYAEWVKRGRPEMELYETSDGSERWIECAPAWCADVQYRFKDESPSSGDPVETNNGVEIPIDMPDCHRAMYAEWVKRGKPQMEFITPRHSCWLDLKGDPVWLSNHRYRFKDSPLDEKSKALRHLLDEMPIAKFDPRIVEEADAKVEYWMGSGAAKTQEHDAGQQSSALKSQVGGDHYSKLKIQPAQYCHANGIGHMAGDAISYITRYKDKNGKQDLLKAIHSLQLLIELEYGDEA